MLFPLAVLLSAPLAAQENPHLDYAQVEYVKATETATGVWTFEVTVRHADEGWDHYADAWRVVGPDTGRVLGERILLHPHDTEQPFTRSEAGIEIPGLAAVRVAARCTVHGFGGRTILVDLEPGRRADHQIIRR